MTDDDRVDLTAYEYEKYLEACIKDNPNLDHVLTKEEFHNEFIPNIDSKLSLGFIPPMIPRNVSPRVSSNIGTYTEIIKSGINILNQGGNLEDIVTNLGTSGVAYLATQTLKQFANSRGNFIKVSNFDNAGSPKPIGPLGVGGGGTSTNPFDVKRLNYGSKSVEVVWNTPIVPNTYSPYFLGGSEVDCPLHVTTCLFSLPAEDPILNKYFETFITIAYQNAIQASVSFNIDLVYVTASAIIEYLNLIIYSLQLYFFYASVLSFCEDPNNRNEGMTNLRMSFTAVDLSDLYILQRLLLQLPIPPRLMDLIFYISQNFRTSGLPGSSIIRMVPIPFVEKGPMTNRYGLGNGAINNCIEVITGSNIRRISSILARACPSWINDSLYSGPSVPLHDVQFSTLWSNLPFIYHDFKKVIPFQGPIPISVTGESLSYFYNSYADILDGGIFAMFTGWNPLTKTWLPGLIKPISSAQDTADSYNNRFSFIRRGQTDIAVTDFYAVTAFGQDVGAARGEAYIADMFKDAAYPHQKFGTEVCKAVTSDTVRQSTFALIEWMLCIDDIGRGTLRTSTKTKRSRRKKRV